jgi:O-methyltransferase
MLNYLRFHRLFTKFRHYTMIGRWTFVENLQLAQRVLDDPKLNSGCIIECGTWKGGMAAALAEIGVDRSCYFFDSFEGLPRPTDLDGENAKEWQANVNSPMYYNNCGAPVSYIKSALALTGRDMAHIEIHKGFFEQSLPNFDAPPIAVLRLDGDWYDSTLICLKKFWPHVLPRGIVLIDDYYVWDGCSRAVHDFLSETKATERIMQGPLKGVPYIIKR